MADPTAVFLRLPTQMGDAGDRQRHLLRAPWRDRLSLLTKDFPPASKAYRCFARLRDDGTRERINHYSVMPDRERVGREASPTAAVIDSQSVKTTGSGGVRGCDAGKKINDRKRHAMVDTDGRALKLQAHSAVIQDRDGLGRCCGYPPELAVRGAGLCRRWLCRAAGSRGQPDPHRGGAQSRQLGRLRRYCRALGRRVVLCPDQPD